MTSWPIPGFPRYTLTTNDNGETWQVAGPRAVTVGYTQGNDERRYVTLEGGEWHGQLGRLVLLTLVGSPPQGKPFACHRNGNPLDNRPSNLYWGSPQDNADDAKRHGVHKASVPRGEEHYHCTIPESVVEAIRGEYIKRPPGRPKGHPRNGGLLPGSMRWLAEKYELSQQTVKQIVLGRSRLGKHP